MSLLEDTTEPVDKSPELSESLVEDELRKLLHPQLYSFIQRLQPCVDRIEYDEGLERKHVWIHAAVPVPDPSEATIKGVRSELNRLADRIWELTKDEFAISIVLDK